MRILISNDDGVLAPGIFALVKALSTIAEIEVIAPDRNRSGASNSLTLSRPLRVRQLDNGHHSVEGTPTDCVHLGLTGYFDKHFDMVVSGINDGANLGDDILYSGTVAAAMEGRSLGLPAIAVSLTGSTDIMHYNTAALIVKRLVQQLQTHSLPSQTILNVNVPNLSIEQIKRIEVTRLGSRHLAASVIKKSDPRGQPIYWIGPPGAAADAGPGTDFFAISEGSVSITPLHLDMTHYKLFDRVASWMDDIKMDGLQ
jgi:5'-nucleotidase